MLFFFFVLVEMLPHNIHNMNNRIASIYMISFIYARSIVLMVANTSFFRNLFKRVSKPHLYYFLVWFPWILMSYEFVGYSLYESLPLACWYLLFAKHKNERCRCFYPRVQLATFLSSEIWWVWIFRNSNS